MGCLSNILHRFFAMQTDKSNKEALRTNNVIYGENLLIYGAIHINNLGGSIIIGDNVVINSGTDCNPAGGAGSVYITVQKDAVLKIGNNVGISNCIFDVWDSVVIEDNVAVGACCIIRDNDAHPLDADIRLSSEQNYKKIDWKNTKHSPILIKEGAFLGLRSIVLKGVTIGKGSVVGAGAVVTKSIPDKEIWAGNPAHFIRKI